MKIVHRVLSFPCLFKGLGVGFESMVSSSCIYKTNIDMCSHADKVEVSNDNLQPAMCSVPSKLYSILCMHWNCSSHTGLFTVCSCCECNMLPSSV